MEVIQSYFTDPELSNDTLRQVRSILCFIESRSQVPLNVVELEDLAELIRTIINNLELQYATEQAALQPCFDMFLSRYAHGIELTGTLTDEPVVFDENYKPEELVGPLTEMLEMLLAKGVYIIGLEDNPYIVGVKEVFAQITNLFFNIFPKVLSKNQLISKETSLIVYKGMIDSMAIISSCCELFQPEILQPTAYQLPDGVIMQKVNKDTILPFLPDAVLKNMARLLRNLNIQTFEHLQHLKRQYTLDSALVNDIQAAVLFFLDNLLYQYNKADLSIIIDQVGDFLACPISHGNLKLSLSILQTIKITTQSFDVRKLTRLLVNQIFNTGGLYVDSIQTAEMHLALLNALYNLIQQFPSIATIICEDSDVLLKNENPFMENVNRTKKENLFTTKIVNNRIVDEYDREEEMRKTMKSQALIEGEIIQQPSQNEDIDDNFTNRPITSDMEEIQRIQEYRKLRNESREAKSPIYSPQQEPRARNANFVKDYLIKLFQMYGVGGYHSSRELIKILKQVNAQSGKLKQNVIEGHSVNFIELNKTRIKLMNENLVEFNKIRKAQAEEDERQLNKIRSRGLSMKTTTMLYNYQQMQKERNIQQERQMQKVIQHSLKFSNAVEAEKDEDGSYLKSVGLTQKPRKLLVSTGTNYSTMKTFKTKELDDLENQALHEITMDSKDGTQNMTAVPPYDPEKSTPHEQMFVLYSLMLLKSLLSTKTPNRQLQLALNFDEDFINGLISFISIQPEATLDVIYAGIVSGRTLFINNIVVEYVDQLIQGFNQYGAIFINNLFEAYGDKLPFDFIEKLTIQCSNGLVVLACQQPNQIVTEQCLGALAFLAHRYGEYKRSSIYAVLLPYVQEILSTWLITSLGNDNSPSTLYITAILIYCLFGVPRNPDTAQSCYDSGVYKALIRYLVKRFDRTGEPPKITPSDIVVVRSFTDLLNDAPQTLAGYTRQQIQLQTAMCNIYKQFQRTLPNRCCDEHGVVYLGTQEQQAVDVVPITDIFISEGGGKKRALSPIAQRIQGVEGEKRSILSPTRSRANLTQLESVVVKKEFSSMKLERFAKKTENFGSLPQSYDSSGPEAKYLLHLNVASMVLAFFRALYPALADPGSCMRAMRKDEFDPKVTGRLGRIVESRPATGATPQIGLKIPTLLPQLNTTNQDVNKENNIVSIGLSQENLLVLLQMIGKHVKAQLIQLSELDDDVLMKDDRVFIDQSKYKLNQRLMTLNLTGSEIADKIRKNAVVGEAKFYNWQAEEE